ncbi:MAG: hypothetical protein NNA21_08455 [Nitrospira sp.]|nr:hypothetical protein [Nitrospira sp.]MCP9460848.1 hypothetical protein [Nitrospira sp.]
MSVVGGKALSIVHNTETNLPSKPSDGNHDAGGLGMADAVPHALPHEAEDLAFFFPRENLKGGRLERQGDSRSTDIGVHGLEIMEFGRQVKVFGCRIVELAGDTPDFSGEAVDLTGDTVL